MSGLSSHLGNTYTYYVAAYLQTRAVLTRSGRLDLRAYDFAIPSKIPSENCTFGISLSLDILASLSDAEYFAECKYNQETRSIRAKTKEFKDGVLEFVGLEKYRNSSFKRSIGYLFITNNSTQRLAQDLEELQSLTSEELLRYKVELENAGREKWKDFDAILSEKQLRAVLSRLVLLEVNDGSLRDVQASPDYRESLLTIIKKAKATGHDVPISLTPVSTATVAVSCNGNDSEYQVLERLGLTFHVEKKFFATLSKFRDKVACPRGAVRIDSRDLSLLRDLRVEWASGSETNVIQALTGILNDRIFASSGKGDIFVQLSYNEKALLVFNKAWIGKIARESLTREGKYEIAKVASQIPFAVPFDVLAMAIIEYNRLNDIVIDHGFFEFET